MASILPGAAKGAKKPSGWVGKTRPEIVKGEIITE
jgi:hypothetical protein